MSTSLSDTTWTLYAPRCSLTRYEYDGCLERYDRWIGVDVVWYNRWIEGYDRWIGVDVVQYDR